MTHDASALFGALGRLDARLAEAVAQAQALAEALADTDPYRGLHISAAEVQRLLQAEPGAPPPWGDRSGALVDRDAATPFGALARDGGLEPLDLDILLIALAPEVDLRYERLYAYLQDDATRRHASVDLILNLLSNDAPSRLALRARLAADAPLRQQRLLHLQADPNAPQAPLLMQAVKVDPQLLRRLLGEHGLDPRLASSCCCIVQPQRTLAQLPLPEPTRRALARLAERARTAAAPLRLAFHGRRGAGKRDAAEALARCIGAPLLALDLEQAGPEPGVGPVRAVELALRDAATMGALLYVCGLHALPAEQQPHLRSAIADAGALDLPVATVLSGHDADWIAALGLADFIDVAFEVPDVAARRACWQANLAAPIAADVDLDLLAQRFRLGPGQIAAAARLAQQRSLWQAAAAPTGALDAVAPGPDELAAAARAQTGHELARLARKVTIRQGWDDLVLPDDQRTQLQEICLQFTRRHVVHGDWGFERKLSLGKGLNCLFSGPPGTGKTMAAEVIAQALQLDLYKIDLSQVVSKYIGETEKNLDRVFGAAEDANAILFFDEADALFGKRSEAKDAHDRYANIEVGYLLQKMEEYAGVAILATNLKSHLDDAFLRRLHAIVEFPVPDEEHRRRIWEGVFPREAPIGPDVDFALLARAVRMSGGNIRNIGLASAFYAAGDGGVIGMPHIARAVRREHQKLGRSWIDWSQA